MEVANFLNFLLFYCWVIILTTPLPFPSSESLVASEASGHYLLLNPITSHILHNLIPSTFTMFS
jgi:hypothetical protein